ncbi:hypothetical protein DPMN_085141 [Dreissena polymorpha]|uniref:Uncharacterized protein n=1 Tax=Dreissena polymorpha TaxID=45954 RepID=A0A9D3YEH1_DREPO|nr:hypothetical protein DPMN_085141 [Dreissena polymorpha]
MELHVSDSNDNLIKNEVCNIDVIESETSFNTDFNSPMTLGPGMFSNPVNKSLSNLLENANQETSKKSLNHANGDPVVVNEKSKHLENDTKENSKSGFAYHEAKTEPHVDSSSVTSGSNSTGRHDHDRVVNLCIRGEWIILDQHMRNIRRGHPSLSKPDPVSKR